MIPVPLISDICKNHYYSFFIEQITNGNLFGVGGRIQRFQGRGGGGKRGLKLVSAGA